MFQLLNYDNWILAKGKDIKIELKKLIDKTNFTHTELVKYLMNQLNLPVK